MTENFLPMEASKLKKLGARSVPTPAVAEIAERGHAVGAGPVVDAGGAEGSGVHRPEQAVYGLTR